MAIIKQRRVDIDAAGIFTRYPDVSVDYDWAEVIWAALTTGRRSMLDVFRFGSLSEMELIWRCALIAANISVQRHRRRANEHEFRYSEAFNALDGSEKSAVTYFLGLILTKLAADRELKVPWLWHLDVYSRVNNPYGPPTRVVAAGASKSRPDLIGQSLSGEWLVCEAKGRSNGVTNQVRIKAKDQTRKISLINGSVPKWRFASVARFSGDALVHEWIDPEGWTDQAEALFPEPRALYNAYYSDIASFLLRADGQEPRRRTFGNYDYMGKYIPGVDVWVGLRTFFLNGGYHPSDLIRSEDQMTYFKNLLSEEPTEKMPGIKAGDDGVLVELGARWY